jgi:hypothetical protein
MFPLSSPRTSTALGLVNLNYYNKTEKGNYNFLLFLAAYKFNVCLDFLRKSLSPPPPDGCPSQPSQHNPIASQKTPRPSHLDPWHRGDAGRDPCYGNYFLMGIVEGGVQLGLLGTAATNKAIVPAPGDYDGEVGGMIGRGN